MGTYAEDLSEIKLARNRMSRFFKVALHCHSPLSKDWGSRGSADQSINNKDNFLPEGKEADFLQLTLERCKCDIIVVTDHMKCSYAERLVKHAGTSRQVVVLPGMEVNFHTSPALANVRLHIIVILPPDCTRETFARLLPGVAEESRRKDSDAIVGKDLREWVEGVHELGGLCIAAHVESENGIRRCFRQTAKSVMALLPMDDETQRQQEQEVGGKLRDLIFDAGFDSVEIRKPEDRHHYLWEEDGGEKKQMATVLGLDAHCIEDYGREDQITLVKMTEPGIDGLRDALKFPETRIRFKSDIMEPPSPRLVGVTISGGNESFFEDLKCGFSENLNCIIGPRGSGKSALVEALRYVFGYNRTLIELDKELADRIRSLQEATLSSALVRLYYRRKDGEVRILEATYDAKQDYTTKVFDEDGKTVPVDNVERSGAYPLRLYGWSEIETLGRDQSKQRSLLDRMIPNIKDSIDRRKDIHDNLESNREKVRGKILELKRTLEKNQGEIYRFSEYKKDFDELDQEAVRECFEEIDLLEAKKNVFVVVRRNVSTLIEDVEGLEPINISEGVEKITSKFGKKLADWWQEEQIREREIIKTEQFLAEEIGKIKQRLQQLKNSLLAKENGLAQQLEEAYEKLRNVLSGEPDKQRIADLRRNAKKRLDRVSDIRDEYLEHWKGFRSLLGERRTLGKELERAQNEVTGIRATMIDKVQERLNQFMGERLRVSIKMLPGGDRKEFAAGLENFLRARGRRISRRLLRVIPARYNPVDFGDLIFEQKWDALIGKYTVDGEEIEIDAEDVEKLRETKDWYEHQEEADINRLLEDGERLLSVLQLQEIPWDDREAILLNEQPVDKLSPGQRSSAMLPLIALAEKSPLVIDQPEDNLDNRLIGHVLVDILAELKEHRQIIVCTHNPNIVVSGDAEQVIALQAESDRKGRLDLAGSIDNDDIVNTVIELMEGGREAFRVRRERYGI